MTQFTPELLLSADPGSVPYVGDPRSEETNPESRLFVAHFVNPCTGIQRNPRGLPVALAE